MESIYYIIAMILIALGGWFLYMEANYKHKVIIKDVVKGRVLIKETKAKEFIDKDKSMWWKILGEKRLEKKLLPMPPEEAIEITAKGRKVAQCYRFESGEITWIKDDWKVSEVPKFDILPKEIQAKVDETKDNSKKKEIIDNYKKTELDKWRKENKIINPIKPITTNQRMSYFYNIKKAESRQKFDIRTQIVPIVAITSLVLIVLGLMIFWGDIAQPAIKGNEQALQAKQLDKEILQELRALKMCTMPVQPAPANGQNIK